MPGNKARHGVGGSERGNRKLWEFEERAREETSVCVCGGLKTIIEMQGLRKKMKRKTSLKISGAVKRPLQTLQQLLRKF